MKMKRLFCFLGIHQYNDTNLKCDIFESKGICRYANICIHCGRTHYYEIPIHNVFPYYIMGKKEN